MKKIFLILSFVFVSTISVKAQDSNTAWADKLFKRFEYLDASKEYLKLVGIGIKQNYIYNQLAESYYNMFNTTEAIKWYALSLTQPQEAETYFKYAQMLKASGRYEESNAQMAIFASKNPKDIRAILFNENPNYIPKLLSKQKEFNLVPVTINSQYTDFGPKLTNDNTLYFSSSRKISKKKTGWKEESYLDVYQASLLENDSLSTPTEVEDINTIWHDGPACVSSDGNTIYFSRDSRVIDDYEDIKNIKTKFSQMYLFKATKVNNKWSEAKQLPFNSKTYSISNPSVSLDGKTLYFNSKISNFFWPILIYLFSSCGFLFNCGSFSFVWSKVGLCSLSSQR